MGVNSREENARTQLVCNQVESLRVISYFGIEPSEVEAIKNVVLFYFAVIFVAFR